MSPGGIGGLLEMTQNGKRYNYYDDGKGNVSACINADPSLSQTDGEFVYYAYDSFGSQVSQTGTLEQPYRFSTKYYYTGYGLVYYGYRFYNPMVGKWMTRDPIGEEGGLNLYGALGNNVPNSIDPLGLHDWSYKLPPGSKSCIDTRTCHSGNHGGKQGTEPNLGITVFFNAFEITTKDGCTYLCWSISTDVVSYGTSKDWGGDGSPYNISWGLSQRASISISPNIKKLSKSSVSGNVGLGFGPPVGGSARLVCFPISGKNNKGCPCSSGPSSIF